jgi:hypothetical protein
MGEMLVTVSVNPMSTVRTSHQANHRDIFARYLEYGRKLDTWNTDETLMLHDGLGVTML